MKKQTTAKDGGDKERLSFGGTTANESARKQQASKQVDLLFLQPWNELARKLQAGRFFFVALGLFFFNRDNTSSLSQIFPATRQFVQIKRKELHILFNIGIS